MAACPQCGSRSIRLVINPLTWCAHLITERRASKCPRCGWRGWKHKKEWLHIPAAGILHGGTGHTASDGPAPRGRVTAAPDSAPRPKTSGPTRDAQFETVVTDGVNPPNLDAIDQDLAESRERWASEKTRRGGRTDRPNP
jgi:hypothetical protein